MKGIKISFYCLLSFALWNASSLAMDCCRNGDCIEGNGVINSEKRNLSFFKSVELKGSFNSVIHCGKQITATIRCDDNILPHIITRVSKQKLMITADKPICTRNDITVNITVPDIETLTAAGSNNISISNIDNQSMVIRIDGSGNFHAVGKTKQFDAQLSGSNDINAKNLRSENTQISIDGSGNATVHADNELEVNINGVGDIIYHGNPKKITKNISGVGDIRQE